VTHATYCTHVADAVCPAVDRPQKRGFFARVFDAMVEARMKQAHREIARSINIVPGGLPVSSFENKYDHWRVDPHV
jgi:hypothetical protein